MIAEFLRRTAWLSAGSIIGRALPVLVLVWLGTRVSSATFASVGLAWLWSSVAYSLVLAGLSTVVVQELSGIESPEAQAAVVQRAGSWAVVGALLPLAVVLALGPEQCADLFGGGIFPDAVVPAACAGAAWSVFSFGLAMLNGMHRPKTAALASGCAGFLQAGALLLFTLKGESSNSAIWGLAYANLVATAGMLLMLRDRLFTPVTSRHSTKRLFSRGLFMATLAAATVTPVNFLAARLAATRGSPTDLAAFLALEQLHQLATYLPNIIAMALLPILVRPLAADPNGVSRKIVGWSFALAIGLTALAGMLGLAGDTILRLLGNPALEDATALRLMMLNAGLALSMTVLGAGIQAAGLFGRGLINNLVWAGLFLGIGSFWAATHGVAGLQAARLLASWTVVGLGALMLRQGTRRQTSGTSALASEPG